MSNDEQKFFPAIFRRNMQTNEFEIVPDGWWVAHQGGDCSLRPVDPAYVEVFAAMRIAQVAMTLAVAKANEEGMQLQRTKYAPEKLEVYERAFAAWKALAGDAALCVTTLSPMAIVQAGLDAVKAELDRLDENYDGHQD